MNALIDTHTHLYTEEFETDRELAVIRAIEAGVSRLFMPNMKMCNQWRRIRRCGTCSCMAQSTKSTWWI